jgi:hypothetical protein
MEILDMQDPEKKRLMDEAKRHKDAIGSDVKAVSERTETIVKNALLIGGALALTYVLFRSFSGGKSKKKKSKTVKLVTQPSEQTAVADSDDDDSDSGSNLLTQIGTKIANEATVLLLDLAKEKLAEYLASRKQPNGSNENH